GRALVPAGVRGQLRGRGRLLVPPGGHRRDAQRRRATPGRGGLTMQGARTILGLDLGQAQDPSALAGLQHVESTLHGKRPVWNCPLLRRWELGTSYHDIVEDVKRVAGKLERPELVVDATGVGRAVVEIF